MISDSWIDRDSTGKSLSEALIFASTNPQYDDRLFIELQVQYMKIPSSNLGEHVVYRNCFWHSEQFLYTTCSAKRRASDKDIPVLQFWVYVNSTVRTEMPSSKCIYDQSSRFNGDPF